MAYSERPACPEPRDGRVMSSLYGGALRPLLPLVSARGVSELGGRLLSTRASRALIGRFIRANNIDMSRYPARDYASFNDFFTREMKPALMHVDMAPEALISPCDSRLTVYDISDRLTFVIKGGVYSVESLLKNKPLAREFAGGKCLVFRLSVDDYHRYCYFDSGTKGENIPIPGRYYTVQSVALKSRDFYRENCREYTVMDTEHFGRAVQAEIGATFVGRISNHHGRHSFERGEEKGMFEFGGSTVVLLLQRGAASIDEDILNNSARGLETRVRLGERIGSRPLRRLAELRVLRYK